MADGRRDLVDGGPLKTLAIPERESSEGAERTFEVWLVSVTMTKFRLSPTTLHAEIACSWHTIFGLSDMARNVNLRRIKYWFYTADTRRLPSRFIKA